MPTPHIGAASDAIAEAVLLPGDPLRAEHIARHFLKEAEQVTAVRNMLGFTGRYRSLPVTVVGTGMGMPSAAIYITELIREYGVQRLIRVGSCGGVSADVAVRDVIVATGACTDSAMNRAKYGGWDFAAVPDYELVAAAHTAAADIGIPARTGLVHSTDTFYQPRADATDIWNRMGVLAIEMETAALYSIASEHRARALAVLTVSDHLGSGEETSSEEREKTLTDMTRIALEALVADRG